jgi:leader peptidase (prepilin peptidase)/N-methyltransferase
LIGLCSGGGLFALLYFGAILVLKREGMGFGDVKLAAALGFLLGWQKFLLSMLIASIGGSLVLVTLNRLRGESNREYPFGPFLVSGSLCGIFFGELVIRWYLALLLG